MATNNDLSSRFAWRDDLVRELIELYREQPCLYDTRSKQYHNRDLRKKCYEEIAEHLGSTIEEVMKKVKCIRSQYSREKHKDRVRRSRSGGVDEIHNSRWLHYDRLAFLDEYLIAKRNVPKSINGDALPDEDDVDAELFIVDGANNINNIDCIPCDPSPPLSFPPVVIQQPPALHMNKKQKTDSEDDLMQKVIVCLDRADGMRAKKNSTHEIFGQYVASELDEIDNPDLQRWAKQQITAVLYQAQSGQIVSSPIRIATTSLL